MLGVVCVNMFWTVVIHNILILVKELCFKTSANSCLNAMKIVETVTFKVYYQTAFKLSSKLTEKF